MADKDQLTGQIVVALDQLSIRNGEHQFEEVCRHVAAKRIAANVVPATGPVQAKGDQGRDFETFRTYLAQELGPHGAFAALASNSPLAFACTMQRDDLPRKLQSDAAKILKSGARVERIYALTAQPIAVGIRHEIEDAARDELKVELTVLDGYWLAEQLADYDLFWVAVRLLAVPPELAPEPPRDLPQLPDWYGESRDRWRTRPAAPVTLSDLDEVRTGLRFAVATDSARDDVPFWLGHMRTLAANPLQEIRQRARYEVAVASIRSQRDLRPADGLVRDLFDELRDDHDPLQLHDAATLLMFAIGVATFGRSSLTSAEITSWNDLIRTRVGDLLEAEPTPSWRARLLYTRGMLALHPDVSTRDLPGPERAMPTIAEMRAEVTRHGPHPSTSYVDRDAGLADLKAVVELVPEAAMFPVEQLADMATLLAPSMADMPDWAAITAGIDEALVQRGGRAAAAQRRRDRAEALLESGKVRQALHELHGAKIDWWAGDSLREALQAMLTISSCYRELRLPHAAKQYGLAVAMAADASRVDAVVDLIAAGLYAAADADWDSGAWIAALEIYNVAVPAYLSFVGVPAREVGEHPVLEEGLARMLLVYGAVKDLAPGAEASILECWRRLNLMPLVEGSLAGIEPSSAEEWAELGSEHLMGPPLNDAANERVIVFAALGVTWIVRCENSPSVVAAAERFTAAAEVLCTELADEDLALLEQRLEIVVETVSPAEELDERLVDDGAAEGGTRWRVILTAGEAPFVDDIEAVQSELFGVLATLLLAVSLRELSAFRDAVQRAYDRGVHSRLFAGRVYDNLLGIVAAGACPEVREGLTTPPLGFQAPAASSDELQWQNGPGPTYSAEVAADVVGGRYVKLPELLRYTLPRLVRDARYVELVALLRSRGWLDWHLLLATLNIVVNKRLAARDDPVESPEEVMREMSEPEREDALAADSAWFTEASMDEARRYALAAGLAHWDLEYRQRVALNDALERFLSERYGYWSDDVDHPDPFSEDAS